MNRKSPLIPLGIALAALVVLLLLQTRGADPDPGLGATAEFATIRWGGRENTHLIRPNGRIEKLRPLLERVPRPDGIDERAYYMSIAMNAVAREGFDVAAMTPDEVVMRRSVTK